VGTPQEIYRYPANIFVASFMGSPPMNMLPGRIIGRDASGVQIALPGNITVFVAAASDTVKVNDPVTLGARPEGLRQDSNGPLLGTTHLIERLGSITLIHADLDQGGRVIVQVGAIDDVRSRQRIALAIDPAHCNVFDNTGRALVRPAAFVPA
jgi:multiple sugar transport system ATP-binding protein